MQILVYPGLALHSSLISQCLAITFISYSTQQPYDVRKFISSSVWISQFQHTNTHTPIYYHSNYFRKSLCYSSAWMETAEAWRNRDILKLRLVVLETTFNKIQEVSHLIRVALSASWNFCQPQFPLWLK